MEIEEEKELINRCVQGNRIAQKELYDSYKTRMYTLAYRITNSFEEAEDVLQEGFLSVFKNLKQFQQKAKLSTWIHTIMTRTAYRKIKNKVSFNSFDIGENEEIIEVSYDVDIEYLEKAIQNLPDGYRTVFVLYEIEGYKHHEIAEILKISPSTSKTQLRNAKASLREQLNNVLNHG